jgi:outer membrane protein OmpA-like peptidoglycan-associated protein
MKNTAILVLPVLVSFVLNGQITVIGHNMLNNTPVKYTSIVVRDENSVVKTFDTRGSSDFKLQLDFGKNYRVYFYNPVCPAMFMEVKAANIPADKYEYRMTYELNVPFVNKIDEDVDTTAFKNAFHRVIYNGKSKMIDDTTYNNSFARTILKKPVKEETLQKPEVTTEPLPVIIAGRIQASDNPGLPAGDLNIHLINKSGAIIKSTATNRYGAFSFTNVKTQDIVRIRMNARVGTLGGNFALFNSENIFVARSVASNGVVTYDLDKTRTQELVDNNYSSNIGGKLVASSPREKKFFADRNIYLANKLNTVVQTTKTNTLGTFVFEDIKPDHTYFLGVDKRDVAAGEKIDLLNKSDNYVGTLDTVSAGRHSLKFQSDHNKVFNDITIAEKDMTMGVKATIFGDNVNNPIGKLKVVLLNDKYEVIDSAVTDNLGTFKFKYLPFLKRFFLSAENTDNMLDVFKNILIYSSEQNLIKIMTHQKGTKFHYNPISAEITKLRDLELDDPWLQLMDQPKGSASTEKKPAAIKSIVEKILFENNKYNITSESKEILDKIIIVLNSNTALRLEIGAHTDSKGSDDSNYKLSLMRAETVRNYLLGAGINQQRIFAKGYGESSLVNGCGDNVPCSETQHAENRRIDFKILEPSTK